MNGDWSGATTVPILFTFQMKIHTRRTHTHSTFPKRTPSPPSYGEHRARPCAHTYYSLVSFASLSFVMQIFTRCMWVENQKSTSALVSFASFHVFSQFRLLPQNFFLSLSLTGSLTHLTLCPHVFNMKRKHLKPAHLCTHYRMFLSSLFGTYHNKPFDFSWITRYVSIFARLVVWLVGRLVAHSFIHSVHSFSLLR